MKRSQDGERTLLNSWLMKSLGPEPELVSSNRSMSDYPLRAIGTVPMVYAEMLAYEAVNVAHDLKRGLFLVLSFFRKNDLRFEK